MFNSLQPHGLQHIRLPCPPSPGVCSNSCPLRQWCHPTILSSVVLFSSCLLSFPDRYSRADIGHCKRFRKCCKDSSVYELLRKDQCLSAGFSPTVCHSVSTLQLETCSRGSHRKNLIAVIRKTDHERVKKPKERWGATKNKQQQEAATSPRAGGTKRKRGTTIIQGLGWTPQWSWNDTGYWDRSWDHQEISSLVGL